LVPGIGAHFNRFWKVVKTTTYHIKPGDTVLLEHCQPGFKVYETDFRIGATGEAENSNGNAFQYRRKWASGIIFIVDGYDIYNPSTTGNISMANYTSGSVGAQNFTSMPPTLLHTYVADTQVRANIRGWKSPRLTIGHMPNAAGINISAADAGYVPMGDGETTHAASTIQNQIGAAQPVAPEG
jgi:hypothetical protein